MVEIFADDATRAVIADWVELELHRSDRKSFTDADLNVAGNILADPEHGAEWDEDAGDHGEFLDAEILDLAIEARRDDIWEELLHRQEALGDLYPFTLTSQASGGWRLERRSGASSRIRAAHWTYVAALYMSSFKHRHIRRGPGFDAKYTALETGIASHFQAISVLAAANLLGNVYWFGWPRPNGLPFHKALQDVIDHVGHGKLRATPPTNRTRIKDGTVDLVAWKSFGDRTYGSLILYGQVASGNNWQEKPVYMFLSGNFLDHFEDHPSGHYLGATFIPFLLHTDLTLPTGRDMVKAMQDDARQLEKNYGTVIDRLRLTELIGEGGGANPQVFNAPTPQRIAYDVIRWVRQCVRYCAI